MITVVLTIYNRTQFYKTALDSLANQNDLDFQLLIYTNIDIQYDLQKFKEVDTIYPQKKEMAFWLSDALRNAKYDKIAFLDDDDTFQPNKIAYLNQHEFQYLHNDYNHLTSGNHINGNGFNMSCIAINRIYFPNLPSQLENHIELATMPDTFVYWYSIEHNVQATIIKEKLTNYRFRDYKTLKNNAVDNMKKQINKLKEFAEYFQAKEIHTIIRQRLIQDLIYLRTFGEDTNLTFIDLTWLIMQKNVDNRKSLIASYILTMPILKKYGMNLINKIRQNTDLKGGTLSGQEAKE